MSKRGFAEDQLEEVFIRAIEDLGYQYIPPQEMVRSSLKTPIAEEMLKESLMQMNPGVSLDIIERAIQQLTYIDAGLLASRNETFFDYLQNGIEVSYYEQGKQKTSRVYLLDTKTVENNTFVVTSQLTIVGKDQKRPDILLFVNGLPLVVIELKSAMSDQADIHSAYRQIRNYQQDIEELFVYNAFNIISDYTFTKLGTLTADESWYKEWKTTDGSYETTKYADFHTLLEGTLTKERLLDILMNFIMFEHKESTIYKIMAQYHQYFAVHKAAQSTYEAMENGDGRGGVFWHTQGSGKSLSMVFYTQLMTKALGQPTFVVITDRNDLDDQLYGQFSRTQDFLRQKPVQAQSRDHLKELLNQRQSNGIFFTTMQKFAESEEALTDRNDVIVIVDEAHRSQYGLREKITRDGKVQHGMARLVRKSLPRATYIGFTGTPLSENDKDTQEIFGNYIDVYDMTQSVEDGATKPVYYENRVINLGLKDQLLQQIDDKYEELSDQTNEIVIEESKQELSRLEVILGSDEAIDTLVEDIVTHYEKTRENLLTGKAMVVAYNRRIAIKIYQRMLEIRPEWQEKVEVVMTGNNNDPEEWKQIVGSKADRDELARKFKDDNDPMKIAIVVDMWLTGFDIPSLATMYIYKPMRSHNLMQAIARVNRVFEDKEGGLIVDYIGIAEALKDAMSNYTTSDKQVIDNSNIRDSAYPRFQEKLEVCRNVYFNNFSYSKIFSTTLSNKERADLIGNGIDHVFTFNEKKLKSFKQDAYELKQAHTLCSSITTEEEQREASFFEAIRISVNRIRSSEKLSKEEVNAQISELLEQSIQSEGVINLFKDFEKGFSLFDQNFLDKIEQMEQKNLSIELLNKLLNDEVKAVSRYDVVKGQEFSEKLKTIMKRYHEGLVESAGSLDQFTGLVKEDADEYSYTSNKAVSPEDIRQALMDLAKETINSEQENEQLGLSREELAFYHALNDPDNIQNFYNEEELVDLTKELTETISEEMSPDWEKRESGKAHVRRAVKRLLKKHNYPPKHTKSTIKLVIEQAEHWDSLQTANK